MRINVYSQELITDQEEDHPVIEEVRQKSNTGVIYSAVRLLLHSSPSLHYPPMDDDRSAVTFWLPKSPERREWFAKCLENMAIMVRNAPAQTGLD